MKTEGSLLCNKKDVKHKLGKQMSCYIFVLKEVKIRKSYCRDWLKKRLHDPTILDNRIYEKVSDKRYQIKV